MNARLPDGVRLEDRGCPNGCPAGDRLVVQGQDRLHGIPGTFRIVQCERCGLMRTNPRPTADTIGAYYPDDYGPYSAAAPAAAADSRQVPAWRRRLRAAFESRRLPPVAPGRLLEIGCASGQWLEAMRRSGWQVQGIEFSDSAAQQARSRGLQVETGSVETAAAPAEPVDVIAAWMVLEHLHEPLDALRRLRSWVRPDGWLVASVPDAGALIRRVFGSRAYDLHLPNHLYHYTPATIERLLAQAGWQLQEVYWQRNANTLLRSLEYLAADRGWRRLLGAVRWLGTAPAAGRWRALIAWLLGATRQSGRIEIWARPAASRSAAGTS